MYEGQIVLAQLREFLPRREFNACVARYRGDHRQRSFSCRDQFLAMAFAQLTFRESLRDITTCLQAVESKLYHAGFRSRVLRSTLADANRVHDWRIYADFAQVLIRRARRLYASEPLGVELNQTVYALDSTTIDLCLSLFPWARFRRRKGAVKLHTLLDLRGSIPCFVHISHGKMHDVTALDLLPIEPGAFYVMDRGYVDFLRLYRFTQGGAFFVTRGKRNLDCTRRERRAVDKATGLRSDQTIVLAGPKSSRLYPDPLRRVAFYDAENDRRLVFLTNNFALPALTVARLYKCRWQVELFFKWIKQHLRIKAQAAAVWPAAKPGPCSQAATIGRKRIRCCSQAAESARAKCSAPLIERAKSLLIAVWVPATFWRRSIAILTLTTVAWPFPIWPAGLYPSLAMGKLLRSLPVKSPVAGLMPSACSPAEWQAIASVSLLVGDTFCSARR